MSDFSRIVVDFHPDLKLPADGDITERLWEGLNKNVATIGMTISGAQFTVSKNLLLTITPPTAARRFMEPDVQDRLRAYLTKTLEICKEAPIWVYPAEVWPRVVIYRLRVDNDASTKEGALRSILSHLSSYNPFMQAIPTYMLLHARILSRWGKKARAGSTVSVCVPVRNLEDAKKLVKEGVFFKGSRHQVALYKAKQTQK
ncbi:hypothetical protein CVT26_015063 [Gymnopilus dilepis]|uniref:Uncharacterized protein n=1 Tax=Gymnopilus dilepis TaxID=231916 RepID=A0A409X742_9AGAR|nr:hypothetical protein CVT26_015063 [Gymnopilus dilepis]